VGWTLKLDFVEGFQSEAEAESGVVMEVFAVCVPCVQLSVLAFS
jgi:hypothetical protein